MDDVDRFIHRFRASPEAPLKLDALMNLGRIRDSRVLEFLLSVIADPLEAVEIRLYVLKHTRNGGLSAQQRARVARVYLHLVSDTSPATLRLEVIFALGGFADIEGVVSQLCRIACCASESFDIRYAAFTALERAGPVPEYLAVLHELAADEMLGQAAQSALLAWSERPAHRPLASRLEN